MEHLRILNHTSRPVEVWGYVEGKEVFHERGAAHTTSGAAFWNKLDLVELEVCFAGEMGGRQTVEVGKVVDVLVKVSATPGEEGEVVAIVPGRG